MTALALIGSGSTTSGGNITIAVGSNVGAATLLHMDVIQDAGDANGTPATAVDSQGNTYVNNAGARAKGLVTGWLSGLDGTITTPLTTSDHITITPGGVAASWTDAAAHAVALTGVTGPAYGYFGFTFASDDLASGTSASSDTGSPQPVNAHWGFILSIGTNLATISTGHPTGAIWPADWGPAIAATSAGTGVRLETYGTIAPLNETWQSVTVAFSGTVANPMIVAEALAIYGTLGPAATVTSQAQIIG